MDAINRVESWLNELNIHYFIEPSLKSHKGIVLDTKPRILIYESNSGEFIHILTLLLPISALRDSERLQIFQTLLKKNAEWNMLKFVIMFNNIAIKIDIDRKDMEKNMFKRGLKAISIGYQEFIRLLKDDENEMMYR